MVRNPAPIFDEKALTKDELQELNTLRKSVGKETADQRFLESLRERSADSAEPGDSNAAMIADALVPLIEKNKLQIPRGGYLIRRGHGRIIVERPASD